MEDTKRIAEFIGGLLAFILLIAIMLFGVWEWNHERKVRDMQPTPVEEVQEDVEVIKEDIDAIIQECKSLPGGCKG